MVTTKFANKKGMSTKNINASLYKWMRRENMYSSQIKCLKTAQNYYLNKEKREFQN